MEDNRKLCVVYQLVPLPAKLLVNIYCIIKDIHYNIPTRSRASTPRFSPLIVTRVPGGPSFGDIPVTCGDGLLLVNITASLLLLSLYYL